MNEPITFTPHQIIEMVLWICGTIVTLSAAITIIIKVVQKMKAPEKTQNERIEKLEKQMEKVNQLFDNDNKRLKTLEEGNRVTQQAILALLSHAINGNDVDSLRDAKTNLENYLIGKEVHTP